MERITGYIKDSLITIFLGISVAFNMTADKFLNLFMKTKSRLHPGGGFSHLFDKLEFVVLRIQFRFYL